MKNNNISSQLESSFRDPSGFLFRDDGKLYRQVNNIYSNDYDLLYNSGLYKELVDKKLLIPHKEVEMKTREDDCYKVIIPEYIQFISYPYEWSFGQLKDAALLTLEIQKIAIKFGMSLKDATSYNIQFHNGAPVFIDTLSFEKYNEGEPWCAYKQFCQHFLSPLSLMSYSDVRLNQLLKNNIDGIPLDLTSRLLPWKSKLNISILSHIHLHAKAQKKYESKATKGKSRKLSKFSLLAIIDSLEQVILKLKWRPAGSEWGDYYNDTNYSDESFQKKMQVISELLDRTETNFLWDIGANNGIISRIASQKGINTVCFDIDPDAIEYNYLKVKKDKEKKVLPLILDLTNPSPNIGWHNNERESIFNRTLPDTVFAMAIIHHIAISNNIPLYKIAYFFAQITKNLIIEFVPKEDSQVQRLLSTREDVFPNYTSAEFEKEFQVYFNLLQSAPIENTARTMYLFNRKD